MSANPILSPERLRRRLMNTYLRNGLRSVSTGASTVVESASDRTASFVRASSFLNGRMRLELARMRSETDTRSEFVAFVKSGIWKNTFVTEDINVQDDGTYFSGTFAGGCSSWEGTSYDTSGSSESCDISSSIIGRHPSIENCSERVLESTSYPPRFTSFGAHAKKNSSSRKTWNHAELSCLLIFVLSAQIGGTEPCDFTSPPYPSAHSTNFRMCEESIRYQSETTALISSLLSVARAVSAEDMEEELKRPDWADDVFAFLQSLTSVSIAIAAVKEENIPSRFRVINASSLFLSASSSSSSSSSSTYCTPYITEEASKEVVNTCPIVFANEAFTALSGRSIASVLGKSVDVLQTRLVHDHHASSKLREDSIVSTSSTNSFETQASAVSLSSLAGAAPLKLQQPRRQLQPSSSSADPAPLSPPRSSIGLLRTLARRDGAADATSAHCDVDISPLRSLLNETNKYKCDELDEDDEHCDKIFDQFVFTEDFTETTAEEERSGTQSERGERGEKAEKPAFIDLDPLFSRTTSECLYVLHVQRVYEQAGTRDKDKDSGDRERDSLRGRLSSTEDTSEGEDERSTASAPSPSPSSFLFHSGVQAAPFSASHSAETMWRSLRGTLNPRPSSSSSSSSHSSSSSSTTLSAKHRLKPQARGSVAALQQQQQQQQGARQAPSYAQQPRSLAFPIAATSIAAAGAAAAAVPSLRALFQRDEDVVRAFLERILLAD